MQASSRKGVTRTNEVAAGSVWETRMKLDQVKGGIKVFNGEDIHKEGSSKGEDNTGLQVYNRRLRRNQSDGVATDKKKRRNWNPTETDKSPIQLRKTRSESSRTSRISCENSREFGGEKIVQGSLSNVGGNGDRESLAMGEDCEDGGGDGVEEINTEMEKESTIDVKEMVLIQGKPSKVEEEKKISQDMDLLEEKSMNAEEEEKINQEVDLLEEIPMNTEEEKKINQEVDLLEEILMNTEEEEKINQICKIPILINVTRKQLDVTDYPKVDPRLAKPPCQNLGKTPPVEVVEEFYERCESFPETQNRMRSFVDLIMWRDISRSAFVFGIGTFLLLSSSYTKDMNFSLISAISYLGLVYLASIFLYKSVLRRGVVNFDETTHGCLVGEEEAIWLLKLLLPHINELLIILRALFSGDPPTTMKLAALLFVLARCGSSITIWTMAKLAFFGVFTIPKICSSYSVQLALFGKFWLERLRDGWESCTHKKAVAGAVFTLIWNLSSTVARVWTVFMLVVAFRYYQQFRVEKEEWGGGTEEEEAAGEPVDVEEDSKRPRKGGGAVPVVVPGPGRRHRHNGGSTKIVVVMKEKKK